MTTWKFPNISEQLMQNVDHAIKSVKNEHGSQKYTSRRHFFETSARLLLSQEGMKIKEVTA